MAGLKRLLIVARRLWPCTNDAALRLRCLIEQLSREQWRSTILTPRWHSSWSSNVTLENSKIHRIDAPPVSPLRQVKYLQNLKQWVTQHYREFDAVYCDQADWDAETVLNCISGREQPAVVRLDWGEAEDNSAEIIVRACSKATAVLVPTQVAHQKAIGMGLPPHRLVRFPGGIDSIVDRSESARREARKILSEVNGDLHLARHDRLIVVPGELTHHWRIEFLIRAIGRLIDDQPGLRVWILGAGSNYELISDLLREYSIHRLVALPGIFTSIEPVLQAADLCLFPGRDCGLTYLLPTCIQSGIPILAARTSEFEKLVGPSSSDLSFEWDSVSGLQQQVRQWWSFPKGFDESARSAQEFFRAKNAASHCNGKLSDRMRLQSVALAHTSSSYQEQLRPAQ